MEQHDFNTSEVRTGSKKLFLEAERPAHQLLRWKNISEKAGLTEDEYSRACATALWLSEIEEALADKTADGVLDDIRNWKDWYDELTNPDSAFWQPGVQEETKRKMSEISEKALKIRATVLNQTLH